MLACAVIAMGSGPTGLSVADLPVGAAPSPVSAPWFPSPLHALVWRNWQLVPVERIARTVGATRLQISALARRIGLSDQPRIPSQVDRGAYLSVIRRNWHLLPYDQLLGLLDWTPERMQASLREDDFLYAKLGQLKPKCEPVRWSKPGPAELAREREIAAVVRVRFPGGPDRMSSPLLGFVAELSRPDLPTVVRTSLRGAPIRMCHSYFAACGDPLLDTRDDPYPDGYLARLAKTGVNAVWLHGLLHRLAPSPFDATESAGWGKRLANLRRLTQRAARRGIRIFLYLNEPRARPLSFFKTHPELKGAVEGDQAAMCLSVPAVRDYVVRSVETICREVPELGGFFTITASENLTHCWSHYGGATCSRCASRSGAVVTADASAAVREGIDRAGSAARLIVWDWGWQPGWIDEAVSALPPGCDVMSVSEWDLPINRGGIATTVGEYSISVVGPGPRAPKTWDAAIRAGHTAVAKVQAALSWEMSAVPYAPTSLIAARHAASLRAAGVRGLMLGWTLGGYPSPNLDVMIRAIEGTEPGAALRQAAERIYGVDAVDAVVEAWERGAAAFAEYPFHITVAYNGPQHVGPANPLWERPTGYASTMVGFPYDHLDGWRAVYPREVFAAQMARVADGCAAAVAGLRERSSRLRPTVAAGLAREADVIEAAGLHLRSVAQQSRFIMERDALESAAPADRQRRRAAIMEILRCEIDTAVRLHAIQCRDPRIGFEASNHYYYVPVDLAEKVINCEYLLTRYGASAVTSR